ncbi:hypothetical protein FJY69_01265, partial [candidate division WOR-3 bacterium]|nr:hypothetical protein [candidate division WOR-3 bacterium]
MTQDRFDISARTRVVVFGLVSGCALVVTLLLKFLGRFDWGVLYYGFGTVLGLGVFLALFLGRPTPHRRWLSFITISLTAAIAAA